MSAAMSQEAYEEMVKEQARGPVNPLAEAHAEAMQLGLMCPFDCAACEAKADRHEHVCTGCGDRTVCYAEQCFWRALDFEGLNMEATVWSEDGSHAVRDPAECAICSPPVPEQPSLFADADPWSGLF